MNALILAAGEGSRLRPYTENCPKCLVEVCGRPILLTQLRVMQQVGLNKIFIAGGYLSEQIRQASGINVLVNQEYASTNMVWTLKCAYEAISDDIVISYGDIVYPPHVLELLLQSKHDVAVAIDVGWQAYWEQRFNNVLDDAETLKMDEHGLLTEIGNKPQSLHDISGQYIGLMRFKGAGAQRLRLILENLDKATMINGKRAQSAYMTDLLQMFIHEKQSVEAILFEGDWCEVDSPSDLEIANIRAKHWIDMLK